MKNLRLLPTSTKSESILIRSPGDFICKLKFENHSSRAPQPLYFIDIIDCVHTLSLFSHIWLYAIPWTVAHQVPLSMGFPRREYQSELPCPSQGIFPTQGPNPCLAGRFFTTSAPWELPSLTAWCTIMLWLALSMARMNLNCNYDLRFKHIKYKTYN